MYTLAITLAVTTRFKGSKGSTTQQCDNVSILPSRASHFTSLPLLHFRRSQTRKKFRCTSPLYFLACVMCTLAVTLAHTQSLLTNLPTPLSIYLITTLPQLNTYIHLHFTSPFPSPSPSQLQTNFCCTSPLCFFAYITCTLVITLAATTLSKNSTIRIYRREFEEKEGTLYMIRIHFVRDGDDGYL